MDGISKQSPVLDEETTAAVENSGPGGPRVSTLTQLSLPLRGNAAPGQHGVSIDVLRALVELCSSAACVVHPGMMIDESTWHTFGPRIGLKRCTDKLVRGCYICI